MQVSDLLPWNWHSKDVAVQRPEASSFSQLQTNINHLFEDFLNISGPVEGRVSGFLPALDVANDDEGLSVTLELAGLDEKDIDVSIDHDVLTIRGEKRSEQEESRDGVQWSECSYGAFRRGIPLPPGLDLDSIQAKFKKGVLRVKIPRTAESMESRRSVAVDAS